MMSMHDFLETMREPVPEWLLEFELGGSFDPDQFLSSRIVFYPGSYTDGHPVKLFGSSHCAHCFVYTDYNASESAIRNALADPMHGFLGYRTLEIIDLNDGDLTSRGWTPHLSESETIGYIKYVGTKPYGFLVILDRADHLDDAHGAQRMAVLFLGADAIATYDALFCQPNSETPFCNFIQDHGFGLQYTPFGQGGLLDKLAHQCDTIPEYAIFAENTKIWGDYEPVMNVAGDYGSRYIRYLYKKKCLPPNSKHF